MEKARLESLLVFIDTSIKDAMQRLNETAGKILFVVDENKRLLGTITDGDIRRGIINGKEFVDSVVNVMNKVFTAAADDNPNILEYAKQAMLKRKIEQIPVLDNKGRIIDLILWSDILDEKTNIIKPELKPNQIVIMAGGRGTRLDPFTKIFPKPLIPLGNKTIIELIMERFYKYGFYKFIYTLNYKKEYIKLFLSESDFPYSIEWVEEPEFLGTAGSLALLKDKIDGTFFVVNCDTLLDTNFGDVLAWHEEHKASITVVGCYNEFKIPFGVLDLSDGKLKQILEKPVHDVIINTGAYVMEPHILSYIPQGKSVDMNELIGGICAKEKISVFPISSGWFDIGQWEEYSKTLKLLSASDHV